MVIRCLEGEVRWGRLRDGNGWDMKLAVGKCRFLDWRYLKAGRRISCVLIIGIAKAFWVSYRQLCTVYYVR